MKKAEALLVFIATGVISFLIAQIVFAVIIDPYLVPIIGFRSILAVINAVIFFLVACKLADTKYHFEKKGLKLF